jgi:hypothetical protein
MVVSLWNLFLAIDRGAEAFSITKNTITFALSIAFYL